MSAAVLYVDDEADNITVFEALYEGIFPVRTATSGEAAVRILRKEEVGVVLTDQRMPGMTGTDLAEVVHREFPDVVTIVITAFADISVAMDAINRGEVDRYLTKPWKPDNLELTLRDALGVYGMRRRIAELERSLHDSGRLYALGVVAASLGHEFGQPVTALSMQLSTLGESLDRLQELVPEGAGAVRLGQARDDLGRAQESVRWLSDMVEGVKFVSRPTATEEEVDVGEVVGTVVRMLRPTASRHARVTFDSLPTPPIRASRTKVGQVVLNLIVNALQGLPPRPIGENLVRVHVRPQGGRVMLLVEDNGPGLPETDHERIFHPFYMARRETGTGLGLAIARAIVQEYGGEISVESKPGFGARMKVLF